MKKNGASHVVNYFRTASPVAPGFAPIEYFSSPQQHLNLML